MKTNPDAKVYTLWDKDMRKAAQELSDILHAGPHGLGTFNVEFSPTAKALIKALDEFLEETA